MECGHGLIDQVLLRTGLIRAYCLLRRTWDREPNQLGGSTSAIFLRNLVLCMAAVLTVHLKK